MVWMQGCPPRVPVPSQTLRIGGKRTACDLSERIEDIELLYAHRANAWPFLKLCDEWTRQKGVRGGRVGEEIDPARFVRGVVQQPDPPLQPGQVRDGLAQRSNGLRVLLAGRGHSDIDLHELLRHDVR